MSKRVAAAVVFVALPCALGGCVTYQRPRGEWVEAVDLGLAKDDLQGATIGLQCGAGEHDEEAWTPRRSDVCPQLARLLKGMGATVVLAAEQADDEQDRAGEATDAKQEVAAEAATEKGGEQPTPDFTLVYVDRGKLSDYCGWTLVPSIVYLGVFPCIKDDRVMAELRVLDEDGLIAQTKSLVLEERTIFGVLALYYWAVDGWRSDARFQRTVQLQESLIRYARNVAQTYNVRRTLAAAQYGDEKGDE